MKSSQFEIELTAIDTGGQWGYDWWSVGQHVWFWLGASAGDKHEDESDLSSEMKINYPLFDLLPKFRLNKTKSVLQLNFWTQTLLL